MASPHGNGIVTTRTFLGQLTRLSVRLSGDVVVQVDQRSTEAAGLSPGDPVEVTLADMPVLLTERNGTVPSTAPQASSRPNGGRPYAVRRSAYSGRKHGTSGSGLLGWHQRVGLLG